MSAQPRLPNPRRQAFLFAALGDETRLRLLTRLASGEPHSITQLTETTSLTRQAVTRHLRVLERSRIVRCERSGREAFFSLDPQPLYDLRQYLDQVAAHWDHSLLRLKKFIEQDAD
jgi:DNA-binding transcriptional ArsR family regulator